MWGNIWKTAQEWGTKAINAAGSAVNKSTEWIASNSERIISNIGEILTDSLVQTLAHALNVAVDWVIKWFFGGE